MTSRPVSSGSHFPPPSERKEGPRNLERMLLEASEREKKKIGQDLHDNLCQQLVGAAFAAKALGDDLLRKEEPAAAQAQELATLINEAVKQTRDLVRGLRPVDLDTRGLMSALDDLMYGLNQKIPSHFVCSENVLIQDSDCALQAYRITQETLAYILRMGIARAFTLELSKKSHRVCLTITVAGMDKPTFLKEMNPIDLKIMDYRAKAINGQLDLESENPEDLRITCSFPETK